MAGLQGSILAMCNPLLDVSASVSQEFLDKYALKANDQILAEEKHQPMYKELASMPGVQYIAGGAGQNTARVAQWMLQVADATSYFGCIGADDFGRLMTQRAKEDGVNVQYMVDPSTPTGTCAVCLTGTHRSLVANLAAANNFKVAHMEQPANWALVQRARLVYVSGFFITVSPEAILSAAKHCAEQDKIFTMNISAPFIVQVPPFKKVLMDALPYVDFLFGNEAEFGALAQSEGWAEASLDQVALRVARLPKASGARPRVVVITQGADPTIVACGGKVMHYPVLRVAADEIVDTNGAGDAFVGGFLSQLVCGKDIAEAVRAGNYAGNYIIKQSGCAMPTKPTFLWA